MLSRFLFNDVDDSGKLDEMVQRLLKVDRMVPDFLMSMTNVCYEEATIVLVGEYKNVDKSPR